MLFVDILNVVAKYVQNKDMVSFISTNKYYWNLRTRIILQDFVPLNVVKRTKFPFRNISVFKKTELSQLPKTARVVELKLWAEEFRMPHISVPIESLIIWGVVKKIVGGSIPKTTRDLVLYTTSIPPNFINPSLKKLVISSCITPLKNIGLPGFLEVLDITYRSGVPFSLDLDCIPKTLKYLKFIGGLPQMAGKLPDGIETLFWNCLKYPPNIPKQTKDLYLKTHIIQPPSIPKGYLPEGLKRLNIVIRDNQELFPGLIPDTVEYLKVKVPDKDLSNFFPAKLRHLVFRSFMFSQPLKIPYGVQTLRFGRFFNGELLKCLPGSEGSIPNSVSHLTFGAHFNSSVKECIPASVRSLSFGCNFDKPIDDSIPLGVEHLSFGTYFNQEIERHIPPTVTHLSFGYAFNKSIANVALPNLVELKLGSHFNRDLGRLPDSLTTLILGEWFSSKIPQPLPKSLKKLVIKNEYYYDALQKCVPREILSLE